MLYPQYDGPEGAAENYFTGLLRCEGGKTIQIDCSRMSHSDSGSVVELYGTTGAITHGGISRFKEGEFIRETVDEPIEIDHGALPEEVPVFYYELNHFAMAIAGEVAPDVSALGCLCLHANLGCALRQREARRKGLYLTKTNLSVNLYQNSIFLI